MGIIKYLLHNQNINNDQEMNRIIDTNTIYKFMIGINALLSQEVYYSHNKINELLIIYIVL